MTDQLTSALAEALIREGNGDYEYDSEAADDAARYLAHPAVVAALDAIRVEAVRP